MENIDPAAIRKLIDRQEILDCLTRYTRGVDRFDRELLLSAYHPDAIDDHGVFVGTPERFWDFVHKAEQWEGKQRTSHVIANHTCEIDGDVAHAETYCLYFGFKSDESLDVVGNRYIDRLERRAGEWRIAKRVCVVDWFGGMREDSVMADFTRAAMNDLRSNAVTGRNREDVSYARPLTIERQDRFPF